MLGPMKMLGLAACLAALAGAAGAAEAPNPWWGRYITEARLVALPDGRRMNLYCEGKGAPVVVLDSGLGDGAWSWRRVQDRIAKTTRVCAYDRAGLGRSDPGPQPRDLKALEADLDGLLKRAKLKGPYVLVGHSAAGMTTRLYAYRHPRRTAGLVLVDPSSEGQIARLTAAAPKLMKMQDASAGLARICAKAEQPSVCVRPLPDLPPELADWRARLQGPVAYQTALAESEAFGAANSDQLIAARKPFARLPVRLLTNGSFGTPGFDPAELAAADKVWVDLHTEVIATAERGLHRRVPNAGHYIQTDQPDAVVAAVEEVVAEARARRR